METQATLLASLKTEVDGLKAQVSLCSEKSSPVVAELLAKIRKAEEQVAKEKTEVCNLRTGSVT